MAPEREIQKLWHPLMVDLGFTKKGPYGNHHLPYNEEWTGVVGLGTQSNYGAGSSVSVNLGALWVPHMKLRKELSSIKDPVGTPSYAEPLYELDPKRSERIGSNWRVQHEGPHGPIDLRAPYECLVEVGLAHIRDVLCTREYTVEVFRKRAYNVRTGERAWASYLIGLELMGEHQRALSCLEEFLDRNRAEEKIRPESFVEFAQRFTEKFGG